MKKTCYMDSGFYTIDNEKFLNFCEGFYADNYWSCDGHDVTALLLIRGEDTEIYTRSCPNKNLPNYIVIISDSLIFTEYNNYKEVTLYNNYMCAKIFCKRNTWLYKYIDNKLMPSSKDFSKIQESIDDENLTDFQFGQRISLAIHEATIADEYFSQRRATAI